MFVVFVICTGIVIEICKKIILFLFYWNNADIFEYLSGEKKLLIVYGDDVHGHRKSAMVIDVCIYNLRLKHLQGRSCAYCILKTSINSSAAIQNTRENRWTEIRSFSFPSHSPDLKSESFPFFFLSRQKIFDKLIWMRRKSSIWSFD